MIKIIKELRSDHRTVIQVQGRLDVEAIAELHAVLGTCDGGGGGGRGVTLDLSGLVSVDAAGRECLIGIRRAGGVLHGASLYISKLLEEALP